MENPSGIFGETVYLLKDLKIKHEYYGFPSGALMLDIWVRDKFYVLQFEAHHIGVSEVNDQNIGFDLEPDEKFYDTESFWRKLKSILKKTRL